MAELALAEEQRCHEAATQTATSVESSIANKRYHHEAAAQAAELVELVLAAKQRCHEVAELAMMLAERSLANARHRHGAVASEDLATADECGRHKTAAGLHITTTPTEPPAHINVALRRIRAAFKSLSAPLDALLADIKAIVHDAQALPKTSSPKPLAMLSPSPHPTSSYLGAVLNTNGGGHASSAPPLPTVLAPPSSTVVKGQPLRVCQRAQPCHCTGRRNHP